LQINAEALGLVEGIRERELRVGAALDRIGHRARIAHVDDAGVIAERNRDVILLLRAVHGRQRQRIGQVTGVLADVQLAAVLVEVATGLVVATDGLVGARGIGVREVIDRLLGDVGDGGQLDDVVVGDVPVDLGQPARDLVVGVAIAVGGTTRPGEHAGLVLLLHLAADIHEQAVLDQRATGVHAVAPRVDFDLLALLVDQAVVGSPIVGIEDVLVVGTQAGGPVGHQAAELPLVAAALGHDVDHAAGRTAELGAVAAGDDLHLADAV